MDEKRHSFTLTDREQLDVTGVVNVEKFTDDDIFLETHLGMLNIKGEKMHMRQLNLDGGLVSVEGVVKSLTYTDNVSPGERRRGWLSKVFR